MKKKGFTLIELLAVIIVLAVIALIATPIILNVVNESREKARIQSVTGYADAVKLSYTEEMMNKTGLTLKELADIKMQGEKVVCEYVKFDKEYGSLLHTCKVENKGNYCYANGKIYNVGTEECNNIHSIIFSANIPYNTPNITIPSQTPSDTEYAQSKEIKIEFPSLSVVEEHYYIKATMNGRTNMNIEATGVINMCGTGEYPTDCISNSATMLDLNTWYEVNNNAILKTNTNITVEAIIGNNNEYGSKATYFVNNIDTIDPTIQVSVLGKEATLTLSDDNGVTGYGVSNLPDVEPEYITIDKTTNTTLTYTATQAGTYYAWVKDVSGRINKAEFTMEQSSFSYAATAINANYTATESCSSYGCKCSCGGFNGHSHCNYHVEQGETVTWVCGSYSYSCPNGGTLSGTTCIKTDYTCPNGGTLNTSTNMCEF